MRWATVGGVVVALISVTLLALYEESVTIDYDLVIRREMARTSIWFEDVHFDDYTFKDPAFKITMYGAILTGMRKRIIELQPPLMHYFAHKRLIDRLDVCIAYFAQGHLTCLDEWLYVTVRK